MTIFLLFCHNLKNLINKINDCILQILYIDSYLEHVQIFLSLEIIFVLKKEKKKLNQNFSLFVIFLLNIYTQFVFFFLNSSLFSF